MAGDAVVGQKIEGNIPIVELIQPLAANFLQIPCE